MKTKNLILIAVSLALAGCSHTEYGPKMQEDAEVYDTCYLPAGHGDGSGVGFTSGGNMAVSSVSVDIPARYAVVFKCQHGKFVIDGDRGKEVYEQVSKGDTVTIDYCVKFEVSKDETNPAGYHFIAAHKK